MKVSKRIITFFLALAMLFSLFVFASASSSSGILVDSASINAWESWISSNGGSSSEYWSKINSLMSRYKIGSYDTYDELILTVNRMDSLSSGALAYIIEIYADMFGTADYVVMYDSGLGVYRPYDNNTGLWLVNAKGHFPYYREVVNAGDTGSSPTLTYSWWFRSDIPTGTSYNIIPEADLRSIAKQYSGRVNQIGNYYVILDVTTAKILCSSGHPLAAIANLDQTAVNQTNNYYTQEGDQVHNEYQGGDTIINEGDTIVYEGDTITNNSTTVYEGGDTYNNQFIDIEDNSVNIDGNQYNIDNLWWNPVTQTYNVNAHDEYVYNTTTNEYTTNNFLFSITYDIHYTSITYIGQTEEYEADTYVYYYELPDGRSSADLTAEELEQLSLAFADVVNYARSTDSADMRALYHFDGNTEDSSYWSYCTEFDWVRGASLTYMDEGVFGGSLYLDETEHEFSLILPNVSDVSYDWTLQFRYYQSYTAAPVFDSYISVGGYKVMGFDGASIFNGFGNITVCPVSVGNWNEICITLEGNVISRFVNGVYVSSSTVTPTCSSAEVLFHFGSSQQTYKKIDEVRFTRGVIYPCGVDYTPSAVPHDTNLTLILPDGERPLADEVMVVTPSANNMLDSVSLSDWSSPSVISALTQFSSDTWQNSGVFPVDMWKNAFSSGIHIAYNPSYSSLVSQQGFTRFSSSGSSVFETNTSSSYWTRQDFKSGFILPFGGGSCTDSTYCPSFYDNYSGFGVKGQQYCFSVLLSDGTYGYIVFSFTVDSLQQPNGITVSKTVANSKFTLASYFVEAKYSSIGHKHYSGYGVSVLPASGAALDIVYMELVKGTAPEFTVDWETAMYSSGELEESPVLAVRSNTPISTYTFGGVRPTYPERGQVWAMIEGHRIVSLQQYTGSAWVEVDGRIWTGKRWIPYSSFDVYTLQDCWDVVESGEESDFEYIYSQSGFWNWFQRQWLKFMEKIDAILAAIENIGGSSKSDDEKELDESSDSLVTVFLNLIFKRPSGDGDLTGDNRVTTDNLTDVGSVLDDSSAFFNSGFRIGQFFDELGNNWFFVWFSTDNAQQIDSVTVVAPADDEDPFNHHYYHDHVNSVNQSRGGDDE